VFQYVEQFGGLYITRQNRELQGFEIMSLADILVWASKTCTFAEWRIKRKIYFKW